MLFCRTSLFQVLRGVKTPETALSPTTTVILHIRKKIFIQHGLYNSMQVDPIATSHIAHDERPPNTGFKTSKAMCLLP